MASKLPTDYTSDSKLSLSFANLQDLGVHASYIGYILSSPHDQDKRFRQYLAHVLDAAAARPNKEQLMYNILRAFPREYLQSVVKPDHLALADNFRRQVVAGGFRSQTYFKTDSHDVSLLTDGNTIDIEKHKVLFSSILLFFLPETILVIFFFIFTRIIHAQ